MRAAFVTTLMATAAGCGGDVFVEQAPNGVSETDELTPPEVVPQCPADLPSDYTCCDDAGLACDYPMPSGCGTLVATCSDQRVWQVRWDAGDCNDPACPASFPEPGSACEPGLECHYSTQCAYAVPFTCGSDGLWPEVPPGPTCNPPPPPDC